MYLAILLVFIVFTYFFIVETKGLSLEEISLVMDYGRKEGRAKARELGQHEGQIEAKEGSQHGDKAVTGHMERV